MQFLDLEAFVQDVLWGRRRLIHTDRTTSRWGVDAKGNSGR